MLIFFYGIKRFNFILLNVGSSCPGRTTLFFNGEREQRRIMQILSVFSNYIGGSSRIVILTVICVIWDKNNE